MYMITVKYSEEECYICTVNYLTITSLDMICSGSLNDNWIVNDLICILFMSYNIFTQKNTKSYNVRLDSSNKIINGSNS